MIIRWNPSDEMNRMEGFMRNLFERSRSAGEESSRITAPSWVPAVDAWESDDSLHLVFDIPGLSKEEIQIEVEGDQLTVKGERKDDSGIVYLRKERVIGPFFRSFTLETPVEREKIKASYKSGVLEITLPKKEEVKPKQITIEIAE